MDSTTSRTASIIDDHGWAVIKVPEDDIGPGFAYSIGFHHSFTHPEIILFGLPLDDMHQIINMLGEEIRSGSRFGAESRSSDVLEGYDVSFLPVDPSFHPEYFGQAMRYYGDAEFIAIQCIWPDMQGRFPWDSGVDAEVRESQPLLGDVQNRGPISLNDE